MLSGIVSQQTWPQLLQSIAHKRKQGALEIDLGEGQMLALHFLQGKIVDVQLGAILPAQSTLDVLRGCKIIDPAQQIEASSYAVLETDLAKALNSDAETIRELLRRAVFKKTMDALHEFKLDTTVPWSFRVGGFEFGREAVPIAVSQLLLDLADQALVSKEFSDKYAASTRVVATPDFAPTGDDTNIVLKRIGIRSMNPHDLLNEILLPKLHAKRALLELLSVGGVLLGQQGRAGELAEQVDVGAIAPHSAPIAIRDFATRFTDSNWVPNLIALVFLFAAITVPFFFWQKALVQF